MQTETATLLAVVAAPLAVVTIVAAWAAWMAVRRGRRLLDVAAERLERQEVIVRGEIVTARHSIERIGVALTALRAQGQRLDADVATWTVGLAGQRATIEHLNRGRLGPAVRAFQLAGALARVALLWRAPAR